MARRNYRRRPSTSDRFYDYSEITARFDSVGACGHSIVKGDPIGWNGRARKARCAACWAKWVDENREADMLESGMMTNCW